MEQFVVSARKYRPATFDTVVGQEAVTETLKNAIRSKHLASAFLFTGPRGVGKTTCARILARTINCENLGDDLVACGKCQPCKTFDEGHSLNIFELDAASNNSVEDIRNLIVQVSIAPQVGTKKVYIIDEVHMLSAQAFNAFLKTLEEPPSYAIFILATTEKHKIIPTILSRCQVFDFRRITISDISRHLASIAKSEKIEAEPQALHVIAQKADGGLRDALSIFDQLVSFSGHTLTYADVVKNLNVLDHEHYFSLTESIVRGDIPAALVEYNAILQQGFDGHLFVSGLAHHFRDLLVSQDPSTLPLLEVSEELTVRYGEQAQQVDRELLVKGLDRLAQCDSQYKSSKEPRLLVELMLIQLCRINAVPNAAVEASAQKKSPDLTAAPAASTVVAEPSSSPPPRSRSATVSESDPKPVQAKYVPKRKLANQVSIKDTVTAAIAEAPPTRELEADMGTGMPASSKKVNAALLLQVWRDYALRLKKNGRDSLHATLMANEPTILGPSQIGFTIVNTVQENYMREEKPELLGNLRRQLDDPGLDLVVTKLEAVVKPRYTNLDKFKLMAEKNPALLNLREALDLDLG
ncbi:MAG: DNA polymerase III subunit gamma/tau [Flavobacteriales bacterium]|jgi:DNA polymerase-3 subunit gamma/tau|nr:DNA polymerase III subunit gamma/tau [Flavobacteriales bacterium]MBK6884584.1 DNA polymerase III subunit gamma/tau [Flavobacteriales bacterium]MBK7100986.1 DNA polymerase III subunit gamma/tau [Flavobacteriales bacterium]MBK7111669.1 DNA polymerase III subunit gamma/tau [Flavobacteriales bacterium]MBK7483968.1 DNA polymerase III subunit gamma/tau [Flavobacteriales bacterium]